MFGKTLNRLKALIIAVIFTAILGVILQTQMVVSRLNDLGADISLAKNISMIAYDLTYLTQLYGLFILIALLIAFMVGETIYRMTKFGRPIIYIVAGGTAIFVMLFAMKNVFFGVHAIAGASDPFGIMLQIIAGMIGGFIFERVSRDHISQEKSPAANEA